MCLEGEKERESRENKNSKMLVTQHGVSLCFAVVLMLFVGVLATVRNDDLSVSRFLSLCF